MSREIKQLLKEAKQAFGEKQFKIAEEKCHDVLNVDPMNYHANLLIGAINQETNPTKAAEHLYKATECPGDASVAFQGLLKCVPNTEMPDVCKKYLQRVPSSYVKVHKQLETCALAQKTMIACIEILENELNSASDAAQVKSANESLVQIYMTCQNIDRSLWPLFRKVFESTIHDPHIRDHCKVYIKYLKLLRNLKEHETLLKCSVQMLEIYPNEFIPMDMICWVYVQKYYENDFKFKEIVPKSIESYADEVLEISGSRPSPNALIAKSIYLYETQSYVAARDYLYRANSEEELCFRLLADTHLKLHAFTLAEYCYTKIKIVNLNYFQSLVEQNSSTKASLFISSMEKDEIQLTADEKVKLTEIYINQLLVYKLKYEHQYEKCLEILRSCDDESCEYFMQLGEINFNLKNYPEALNAILRATKLEPYNADCFFWLGKIYMQNGDVERARKCFEKSVFLNTQHEQSVIFLSTIYRQNSEWELNAKLLQNAAQAIPNTPCKWATLLLGFHHLAQNQFDDAITAFRAVLRIDAKHYASWEGLADSYLKRGSYSSALKVYRKICDLTDDNIYAQLQV
ncbi:tetratricopeptide repeat protein 37-like, partial [Contarinia nasturtii]|uniref:tetratricopeptide repeat protein 37-like n=1 Tax=Contarinia nasturtii TaxID=265458 RepID=UPI0012D448DF